MTLDDFKARWTGHTPKLQDVNREYAVLVPLAQRPEGLCLLYEVRADTLGRQPGEVCFPGGRMEAGEDPVACALRETWEETGLTLTHWRSRGLLTFIWGSMTEFIHLYTADGWTGEMIQGDACREGVLEWVPKEKVEQLPIWEGDKIFFKLLNEEHPWFSLKLVYEGDVLRQAVLDGERIVG